MMNAPLEGSVYSPNQLVFGHNWKYPIDESFEASGNEVDISQSDHAVRFVEGKLEVMKIIQESVADAIQASKEKSANRVNVDRVATSFKQGDRVGRRLVRQSSKGEKFNAKLSFMAAGPYIVEEVVGMLGVQSLKLRHEKDTAVPYFLTARDVFPWVERDDDRDALNTTLREAEQRMLAARPAVGPTRREVPRTETAVVDENAQIALRDGTQLSSADPTDQWRDADRSRERLASLFGDANQGKRFVWVRRTEEQEQGRTARLQLARVVEVTMIGTQGAFVGVHFYELVQVTRSDEGAEIRLPLRFTTGMPRANWEVDSQKNTYILLPIWTQGTTRVVADNQPRGCTPDEDMVGLQDIVGEAFALQKGALDTFPRVVPKSLFRVWKDKSVLFKAARDSIILWATREGNQSDSATAELARLTYHEVEGLSAAQTRLKCAEREIPIEIVVEGKTRLVKFGLLKAPTARRRSRRAFAMTGLRREGGARNARGAGACE